jgi:hypothetical protein
VSRALAAAALLAALPGAAGAQTLFDQEQRLIQIHSLLLDLPPVDAPGAWRRGEASLGLEVVTIPTIDGTTGSKRQLTASDQTRAFPRPRVALGLPAPEGFRAFAGLSYVPPVEIRRISAHLVAGEAGIAWAPGALRLGLRGHALYARTQSPVTDPGTRDVLRAAEAGLDLSGGYDLGLGPARLTPYAGVGFTRLSGDFRVESDGAKLSSRYTAAALHGGLRLLVMDHWEAVGEWAVYPGRLIHPRFRVAYVADLGAWMGR